MPWRAATRDADALRQQAERLAEAERPIVLQGDLPDLPALAGRTMTKPPAPTLMRWWGITC